MMVVVIIIIIIIIIQRTRELQQCYWFWSPELLGGNDLPEKWTKV